ncbi:hypothetical protein, partial [Burkholderia cenocepacia]|uniref:hypothetical protein n=1 Tax=Burkholderia cenocepacia TaxID=95486 RepID=UPI001E6476B9
MTSANRIWIFILLFLDPTIQSGRIPVKRLRIRLLPQRQMHPLSSEIAGRDASAFSNSGSIGPIRGASHAHCSSAGSFALTALRRGSWEPRAPNPASLGSRSALASSASNLFVEFIGSPGVSVVAPDSDKKLSSRSIHSWRERINRNPAIHLAPPGVLG